MSSRITSVNPTKLSYAVRLQVVLKYLGQLCVISSVLSLAPLICSLVYQEFSMSLRYLVVIGVYAAVGLATLKLKTPEKMQKNEVFVIISAIFLFSSVLMIIPMMGSGLSAMDAWFEAVSALTTTGLSTSPINEELKSFIFARAFLQWYGGIGIVVLSLGLAMQSSMVAKSLGKGIANKDDLVSSTRIFAKNILLIYGVLSIACLVTLWFFSPSFFDAIVYTFSSVSTGGFSSRAEGLVAFSFPFQVAVLVFSFLGAVSFPLFWFAKMKHFRNFFANFQLIGLVALVVVGVGLVTFFSFSYDGNSIKNAFFTVFSAQSTTGFLVEPLTELATASMVVLMASMAIGGCAQSTAGGFKVVRFLILFRSLQLIFLKTSLSKHTVIFPQIGGHRLSEEEKDGSFSIVFLFFITTFFSWLVFVASGYDPFNALFEVISATATAGFSTGIVHSGLPAHLKSVLCFDMFLGRLEFVTFLTLFFPRTLIGRRRSL